MATGTDGTDEPKSYETILSQQIEEALSELNRPVDGLFLSGVSAGLDLGFSLLVVAAMLTLVHGVYDEPLTRLLVANAYTVGFIFVILGRSELFTEHTTLAVLPVLDGQSSVFDLGRLWGVVYAGNVIGGVVFAGVAIAVGPSFGIFELSVLSEVAKPFIEHSAMGLFGGALLAGWLMGLLSWLVGAAQETTSRIFFVWLVTLVIGFAHLPHCIAGNIEMAAAVAAVPDVTLADYGRFLLVATVGNAIGGTIFVALLKYGHVVRGESSEAVTAD